MPRYEVDLADGRTIKVTASDIDEAIAKREQINAINAQGAEDVANALKPEQVSALEAVILGAERETDKLLSGVQSLFGSEEEQARIAAEQASNDKAFAPVEEAHPWATMGGSVLPIALDRRR